MKILVIGGTGTVGSEVVKVLIQRKADVRVTTNSPDKLAKLPVEVEGVGADIRDKNSLNDAFRDVARVFIMTPLSENEEEEGLNIVNAAKEAGVQRIVYMSVHRLEDIPEAPHFAMKIPIENAIKESGITYTLIRPNNFFQNDIWLKAPIMNFGIYPQPIGKKGLNRIDVRDIAESAANALLKDEFTGKTFSLVGPDLMTGESTARIYGKYLGKEVVYGGDDLDKWSAQAKQMFPEWMVKDFAIMYRHFQNNGLIATPEHHAETERILQRKPTLFDSFAQQTTAAWKQEAASGVTAKTVS